MWNWIGQPGLPAVDEIKIFDNDDKAAKHSERINFINSRRPWPPNSISHLFHPGLFCSWLLLFYSRDWGSFGWDTVFYILPITNIVHQTYYNIITITISNSSVVWMVCTYVAAPRMTQTFNKSTR